MRTDKLTALILAAGHSARMGDFKPLLDLGGEYVIARAVRNFREGGVRDVRVVVGHRAGDLRPVLSSLGVTVVANDNYAAGMFSSVVCGVNSLAADTGGVFLLPGDMPLVKPPTIRRLADAYAKYDYSVIYPCFRGRRGHPPLITRRCFGAIRAENPDSNLRVVLNRFGPTAGEVACIDGGILLDLDTPADYERAVALTKRGPIPTAEECCAFLERYDVPEKGRRHGQKVAEVAVVLARALNERGFSLDTELVRAGGLLHDMAKGHPDHAAKAGEILLAAGFAPVAAVVREHTDLALRGEPPIDERTLVYLADKLVQGDRLRPCAERFRGPMLKFGHIPEAAANIKRRRRHALMLEGKIGDRLGLKDLCGYLVGKTAQRGGGDA